MNGEFRALSLGSLAAILVALGVWAVVWGPDDREVEPALGTADGPVVRHALPYWDQGDGAEISGVLELQGDCLVIAYAADGDDSVLPLVWPAGTSWDATDSAVVLATDDRISIGESVWGGGAYRSAASIDTVDDAAASLLRTCADNSWSEVAVFNNNRDAARPG